MKNRILLVLLAVMLALSTGLVGCGGEQSPLDADAVVSECTGNLSVMKEDTAGWTEAEIGTALEATDIMKCGDNSSAKITFLDGSTVDLEPGTEIEVAELIVSAETDSAIIRLKLVIGSIIFRVVNVVDPASLYEVETPAGVVAVRGSAVQITVSEDGTTWVCNLEGDIWAIAQGVELQVPEGECCIIGPGEPPELIVDVCNLTVAGSTGGSVATPGEGTFPYSEGTVVNLVAEAEEGYRFVEWTGDVGTAANVNAPTTTISMNDDYSITATFGQIPPGKVALTTSSTVGGSVTTPGEGAFLYDVGEVVSLVAEVEEGYRFVNWTGDVGTVAAVNAGSTTINMNGDYSITANFQLGPWDYVIPLNLHCAASAVASVVRFVYAPWAQEVGNATGPDGGKFSFNITYGGTPYDANDSLTALSTGAADLGLLSGDTFYLGSIGYLPFLFPDMASCAYATYNLLATEVEDWDALGELDHVKILLSSPLEPVQWWGNVPVMTLADFGGVRVGCHPWLTPTIEALGATAVEIGSPYDLAPALSAGSIDGCFMRYQAGAFVFPLRYVTQYNTEVNLTHFPLFLLAMNRAKYESLHPDARALLDTFCGAEESAQYAGSHYASTTYYKGIVNEWRAADGQSPIYVLPQEELDGWEAACTGVAPEWINYMDTLGFDGQGIYDRVVELIGEY